jgi:hypothetical protein
MGFEVLGLLRANEFRGDELLLPGSGRVLEGVFEDSKRVQRIHLF